MLTVATAQAILTGSSYVASYRDFGRKYPDAGYGAAFYKWMMSDDPQPYNSWGNGSAMRVSPVGFACQGSVPEAIVAFLDSRDVEDAIRLAISLGGDGDTQAAIAGAIAHAYYKHIPDAMLEPVRARLPAEFLQIIDEFERKYHLPS